MAQTVMTHNHPLVVKSFDSHTDTIDKYFGRYYNHGTPFRSAVDENLLDVDHSIRVGLRGQQYQPDDLEDSEIFLTHQHKLLCR